MKKIIIIAAMALMSVAAMAQETRFAYVDFNEIIMLMPEMDEARATLEENSKTNEEILMTMYQEYQTKVQQYEQKQSTWTPSVRGFSGIVHLNLAQNNKIIATYTYLIKEN